MTSTAFKSQDKTTMKSKKNTIKALFFDFYHANCGKTYKFACFL